MCCYTVWSTVPLVHRAKRFLHSNDATKSQQDERDQLSRGTMNPILV